MIETERKSYGYIFMTMC